MRRRNWWSFLKGILFMQLFILAIIAGLTVDLNARYVETWQRIQPAAWLLPFSQLNINQQQAELLWQESNILLAGPAGLNHQMGIVKLSPENMMGSHIQALAYSTPVNDEIKPVQDSIIVEEGSRDVNSLPNEIDSELFKGYRIYFYCTHSAESYIPDSGKARLDGKRGLVNTVASVLDKDLSNRGINSQFINTIHDYPDYNQSYTNSRVTARQIVESNNNILALFDIHRDSIPNTTKAATIEIKGQKSAQILIVVGTDERKPHPNWKENHRFAQRLYARSEKIYPGLIKGVRTKAGTYNQEFHPRALLLEFGSDYNTLEEANYAARLFNEVLVQVLKEDIQQQ